MLNVTAERASSKDRTAEFSGFSDFHRAAMWLDEEIKKARKGVTTQVVELTPALAEVLLSRNPANRKISDVVVNSYARDIISGAWKFNGEPVIVSVDGFLNDGQHRASAVVQAKISINCVLIIGVERDTRTPLDQGKMRSVGDYLSMEGHGDSNSLAAAASYIWQWQSRGQLSNQRQHRPTKAETKSLIDNNPSIAVSLAAIRRRGADAVGGRSLLAFCHFVFAMAVTEAEATAFVNALLTGIDLPVRDPVLYARNRLMAQRRMTPNERAELIFRAWNSRRRGEMPKTLPVLSGALPAVES